MKTSPIFLLVLALLSPCLIAREIHVRVDASAGGDGSADAPLSSVAAAVNAAVAGDEVILHDGVYRERVEIRRPFESAPLTIRAAEGARPVLPGMDPITCWEVWKDGVYRVDVEADVKDLYVPSHRQRLARFPNVYASPGPTRTCTCIPSARHDREAS